MEKRFKSILSCTLALTMCLMCFFATTALAADIPQTKQMGQVTFQFRGLRTGVESFIYCINLNGYKPKTISTTISGNFTEEQMQAAIESDAYPANQFFYNFLPVPMMIGGTASNDAEVTDAANGLRGETYQHNAYVSNWTLTSKEYTMIPPGNKTWGGIVLQGVPAFVKLSNSTPHLTTIHKVYMDGQQILEYTCSISASGTSTISGIKVFDANFKMPAAARSTAQVAVEPATSWVFVDGKQVDIGAYLIQGSNYMKLRDIAYILRGTEAEFDVAWYQDKNLIEIKPDEKYSIQGGEISPLTAATATASSSQVMSKLPGVFSGPTEVHFAPTAYVVDGNNFYRLRDVAQMAGFTVSWDSASGSVNIATNK